MSLFQSAKRFKKATTLFLWLALLSAGVLWMTAQDGGCRPLSLAKAQKQEPITPDAEVMNLQDAFAKVAALVKPAVVSITTIHVESVQVQPQFYFGDPFEDFFRHYFGEESPYGPGNPHQPRRGPAPRKLEQKHEGMGSGVIIDPKGYILTNEHVVRGADEIKVTVMNPDEKVFTGKVVGKDPRTDLAVVKIDAKGATLSYAALGDSDQVRVGDWSIAVGSPFGLEQTVTVGIISAVRQSLNIEGKSYSNLLQTDAAINRGNSGGPLVNIRGELIGINTAIYAPTGVFSGIGFAIPSNRAKEIMEQLIEKGRVVRGWMGVEIAPFDDIVARQFGVPDSKGVLVNKVLPGSPAAKAGLKRGDVIREFDGQSVPDQNALLQIVAKTPPKKKVTLKIYRDGREMILTLVTGEMPANPDSETPDAEEEGNEDDESGVKSWEGAQLMTATAAIIQRFGLTPPTEGVVVLQVSPRGLADEAGLVEGDIILSLNRQPTPDVETFIKRAGKADVKEGILLDVNRGGRLLYLSYKKGD